MRSYHLYLFAVAVLSTAAHAIPRGKCPQGLEVNLDKFGYAVSIPGQPWDEQRRTDIPDTAALYETLSVKLTLSSQESNRVCYYELAPNSAVVAKPALFSLSRGRRVRGLAEETTLEGTRAYLRGNAKSATLTVILPDSKDEPESPFNERGLVVGSQIDATSESSQNVVAYSYRTEQRIVGIMEKTGFHGLRITVKK